MVHGRPCGLPPVNGRVHVRLDTSYPRNGWLAPVPGRRSENGRQAIDQPSPSLSKEGAAVLADRFRAAVRAVALCAILSLGVVAAPAAAAPPSAQNDALAAFPTGALDVLANGSDPDGDEMKATVKTQPANGTASCSELGACFYSANGGFTGSDSFTYALTAGGEQATATVAVNVTASSAQATLSASDDDVATLPGREVSFNVL